jgi:arginase family enzyme
VYLALDDSWPDDILGLPRRDATAWGPKLRCFAKREVMDRFAREVAADLPPFVLYGSGDFHHVTAALLRNVRAGAMNVVVFDNHPDWDIRPPRWGCGGWVNRALDLPNVRGVSVWGCGNFELNWPARLFRSRDARVNVRPWSERYSPAVCERFGCISRGNWRAVFEQFAASLARTDVYVSIDMDCLCAEDAVTNWESGLFTASDLAWAIRCLRSHGNVIGGDICGPYSAPRYERRKQQVAAEWDHPKLPPRDVDRARAINTKSVEAIWPALINSPIPEPLRR